MNKAEELKKENFKLQAQVNRYKKIATEKLRRENIKHYEEEKNSHIEFIEENHDQLKTLSHMKKSNESQAASGSGVSY